MSLIYFFIEVGTAYAQTGRVCRKLAPRRRCHLYFHRIDMMHRVEYPRSQLFRHKWMIDLTEWLASIVINDYY